LRPSVRASASGLRVFSVAVAQFSVVRPIRAIMKCEICHEREATVDWTSIGPARGREEHLHLCQACAAARMQSDVLRKIQQAQAEGERVVSGWTSYNPTPPEDDKPTA
jgi:hypothetical protein